jgi:hypothetical protein
VRRLTQAPPLGTNLLPGDFALGTTGTPHPSQPLRQAGPELRTDSK